MADVLSCMLEGEGRPEAVAAILRISMDPKISDNLRVGYRSDKFCQQILKNRESFPAVKVEDGLVYIESRLVVPRIGTIRERKHVKRGPIIDRPGVASTRRVIRNHGCSITLQPQSRCH